MSFAARTPPELPVYVYVAYTAAQAPCYVYTYADDRWSPGAAVLGAWSSLAAARVQARERPLTSIFWRFWNRRAQGPACLNFACAVCPPEGVSGAECGIPKGAKMQRALGDAMVSAVVGGERRCPVHLDPSPAQRGCWHVPPVAAAAHRRISVPGSLSPPHARAFFSRAARTSKRAARTSSRGKQGLRCGAADRRVHAALDRAGKHR